MSGPKVAVIGAGSFFFGRPVIHKMATSDVMAGGTLALVDTDPDVLATMMKLAGRVFEKTRCGVEVTGSTDRCDLLKDSDFVVFTFSYRNAHYRGLDTEIAARHGIRMCSSDTIGPGGVFRALREAPRALEMARDVRKLCPDAWVINFVNPTTVMGMVLKRYAPEVKSFALCDGNHEPYNTLMWCKRAGLLPDSADSVPAGVQNKLEIAIGGVNHCTWLTRLRYDGEDLMPRIREQLAEEVGEEKNSPGEHSKARFNKAYALKLLDIYGALPTAVGHTKEYVPFFQGYGVRPVDPEPVALFDAPERAKKMAEAWKTTRQYADGEKDADEFLAGVKDDHATDIIESMWGGLGKSFYINTFNSGAVSNLPDDALLELRCDLDMHGPRPQPFGRFPRGLLALQHQVLDTHELTARAAVSGERAILRRALLCDPICNNIEDVDACIEELLQAEREALPDYWF